MSKKIFISMLVALVAIFGFASVVSAQAETPPADAPASGYAHDYLIAYAADVLGLTSEEIEARIDAGETLAQIALTQGVDDIATFMKDAKAYVLAQLSESGITIPGWDTDRVRGNGSGTRMMQSGSGLCNGTCLLDGTTQQQGQGNGRRGGR